MPSVDSVRPAFEPLERAERAERPLEPREPCERALDRERDVDLPAAVEDPLLDLLDALLDVLRELDAPFLLRAVVDFRVEPERELPALLGLDFVWAIPASSPVLSVPRASPGTPRVRPTQRAADESVLGRVSAPGQELWIMRMRS